MAKMFKGGTAHKKDVHSNDIEINVQGLFVKLGLAWSSEAVLARCPPNSITEVSMGGLAKGTQPSITCTCSTLD